MAVEPLRSCGHCGNCKEGERHRCDAGADIIGVFSDGGMGEYLLAPAEALVRLPSGIKVTDASLVENLAVAVHAVNRARMQAGERVGIIGAGAIGLATAAVLRQAGSMPISALVTIIRQPRRSRLGPELRWVTATTWSLMQLVPHLRCLNQ